MKKDEKSFVVVGPGRVGTAIAKNLVGAGYRCMGLFGRDREKVSRAARFVGAEDFIEIKPDIIKGSHIVFIGVPDDAISSVVKGLASISAVGDSNVLVHFSGLVSSEALVSGGGVLIKGRASMHPNLAFADPATASGQLKGTYFGVEGDEVGVEVAESVVSALGGISVRVPSDAKIAYHLAAVFSSNGAVVLASIAEHILEKIGVEPERGNPLVAKLMMGTVMNLGELGVLKALTGPVVRGDEKTVKAHLDVLKEGLMGQESAELITLYRILFRRIVDLSIEAGRGNKEKYQPIIKLLEKNVDSI